MPLRASASRPTRTYAQANAIHKAARWMGATPLGTGLLRRRLHRIDKLAYTLTRGRFTVTSALTGLQVVMLTTTGAKTGAPRTVAVVGLQTDDGFAVIASNFGQARHPGWYHNLRADPRASVAIRGVAHAVCAVEVTGARRARIWAQAIELSRAYPRYQRTASNREIALFVLTSMP